MEHKNNGENILPTHHTTTTITTVTSAEERPYTVEKSETSEVYRFDKMAKSEEVVEYDPRDDIKRGDTDSASDSTPVKKRSLYARYRVYFQ